MKVGDKVVVVRESEYNQMLRRQFRDMPEVIGRGGVVEEAYYNPSMKRDEVVISGSVGTHCIFDEKDLRIVNENGELVFAEDLPDNLEVVKVEHVRFEE